ncbi:MAG: 50S ribosomal protein L10 [Armatimonadota bacterium]
MAKKSGVSRQIKKKPAALKGEVLDQTAEMLRGCEAVILSEYIGLTVPQMADLRRRLREAGDGDFSVVKNTLFRRAADGVLAADPRLDAALNGTTAATYAFKDPVAVAKAVSDYIAANRNTPLKIKGGVVGGRFYDAAQIDALAKVPPRDVLLSQLLGAFNSPVAGFVGTLHAVLSNFVYTLKAIEDQKAAA